MLLRKRGATDHAERCRTRPRGGTARLSAADAEHALRILKRTWGGRSNGPPAERQGPPVQAAIDSRGRQETPGALAMYELHPSIRVSAICIPVNIITNSYRKIFFNGFQKI